MLVNNNRLYTASDDKSVRVFDIVKGTCLDALSGHTDGVTSLSVAGDILYTGSYDGTVREYVISDVESAIEQRKRRLEEGRRIAQELWIRQREEAKARNKKSKKGKGKGKKGKKK